MGMMGWGWGAYSDEEMWHNKHKQRLAPWHSAKNSSHIQKEKGGGRTFFWYANVSIMWDFAALDSGSCGRVWRNGDIRVYKDWLQTYVPFFQLLSAFKIETLIINVRAPTDLCDILCFINKTSKTHIRLYYSTSLGCETNSNSSYSEISSRLIDKERDKNNRTIYLTVTGPLHLAHKVKEYS